MTYKTQLTNGDDIALTIVDKTATVVYNGRTHTCSIRKDDRIIFFENGVQYEVAKESGVTKKHRNKNIKNTDDPFLTDEEIANSILTDIYSKLGAMCAYKTDRIEKVLWFLGLGNMRRFISRYNHIQAKAVDAFTEREKQAEKEREQKQAEKALTALIKSGDLTLEQLKAMLQSAQPQPQSTTD